MDVGEKIFIASKFSESHAATPRSSNLIRYMIQIENLKAAKSDDFEMSFRRCVRQLCGSRQLMNSSPVSSSLKNDKWLDDINPIEEEPEMPTESFKIHTNVDSLLAHPETIVQVDEVNTLKYRDIGVDSFGLTRALIKLTDYFFGNDYQAINALRGEKSIKKAQKVEQRTFQDLKLIRAASGSGGNGCASFFRDANRPVGPPDGGDGGDGGNVYLKVVKNINSLHKIRRAYIAKGGQPGKGSQLDGKKGEDVLIEVPMGTIVRWIPDPFVMRDYLKEHDKENIWLEIVNDAYNGQIQMFRNSFKPGEGWIFKEHEEEYYMERDFFTSLNETVKEYDEETIRTELYDDKFPLLGLNLDKETDDPILLIKGGKGGMGNMNFLTKDVRNPKFSKKGRGGLVEHFILELKLIADLGLVGLPNAGKSTLLNAISRARPRIGHWEFTTLQPTIGTIHTTIDKDPFTVADIPGIIKGASENKGMGLDFLRHIERCKGLVFVVSLEKNPIEDLQTLMGEMGPKKLQNKKKLIIATKADLNPDSSIYSEFKHFVNNHVSTDEDRWKILPMCAPKSQNVESCIKLMSEMAGK